MIKLLRRLLGMKDHSKPVTPAVDSSAAAPYKVETPPADTHQPVETPAPKVVEAPVVETKPVTVKAKYKKADLGAMKKTELEELAKKHGIEVKARAKKDELVKALSKV